MTMNKDCILFNCEAIRCNGLKDLYCRNGGQCGFYKKKNEYHSDGTKRKYPLEEEAV